CTVPIEHAIGGVAILLNLDQHVAGADPMKSSCRQKHRVASVRANHLDMIGSGSAAQGFLKLLPSDPLFESDKKFSAGCGGRDIPTFSFRFAAKFGGDFLGRMDLKRKFLLRIEQFD